MVSDICSGSTTCEIVLQYVVPSIGCVSGILLQLAPAPAVKDAFNAESLGNLNTLPFALLVQNSLAWVGYGWYIRDYFVFIPNVIGWTCGMLYSLLLLPLAPRKARIQTTLVMVSLSALILFIYGFVFASGVEFQTGSQVMGITANVVLIAFYGSPLSVCIAVVKEKDSSSLNFPLAVTSLINAALWTAYGIAISNAYISAPNALGFLFSILQLILLAVFPRKTVAGNRDADNNAGESASPITRLENDEEKE
ncbi:sugar efflux transporter for intercellular exchange-domain-containing protein [Obelidium mucronatum]|nr:sugar efflux transporter for intercellular exchange-domain-containing protein [Obelidium mucronatum]